MGAFKTTKMAKTIDEAPRRPDHDKRTFCENEQLNGFINKNIAIGRAIKVSHKKIRVAGKKMSGICDGKDNSPSKKKIKI